MVDDAIGYRAAGRQAKAWLQALKNREATRQRKLDTRRKVILGGALLDLAARHSAAAAMVDRLIRNLSRDQDRKAFTDCGDRPTATLQGTAEVILPGNRQYRQPQIARV